MNNTPSNINVNIQDLETITCEKCNNATFTQVVILKKVPAILSRTGQDEIAAIPVFACNACGNVNKAFLPQKEVERESNIQSSNVPQKKKIQLVTE
jgi:uncharacterized Zn finger protein